MDDAEKLLNELHSLVDLQKKGAAELKKLATVMENRKKDVNAVKVIGSSASVGGAAAMAAAGVVTLCTGGLAAPLMAVGIGATGAGLVTNVGAEIVDAVESHDNMKEAEKVSEKIQKVEKEIKRLMKRLEEEGKKTCAFGDISPEDYVVEKLLRAMAKRVGLVLNDKISLLKMVSQRIRSDSFEPRIALSFLYGALHGLILVERVLVKEITEEIVIEVCKKTTAKAAGRIAGGVVGLAFSIPELVISCKNLDNCKTKASQSLRENAEAIQKAAEAFKKNLDEIHEMFKRLMDIKSCIEKTKRRPDEKEALKQFAIKNCDDEYLRQWLRNNSGSETFFSLIDLFSLVKEKLDKEEQKDHDNTVDITFLAHGAIKERLIPAKHVLPLSTVSDVVLHSPWNCALSADAAYDIAAGFMKPEHRKFLCCGDKKEPCQIPDEGHRPPKLPNHWNSMKEAVENGQWIPNIMLSPVGGPEDEAWKSFEILTVLGPPGKNYIIVPFIISEKWSSDSPQRVPFSVVSLALSLVLMFSRFTATVHLTACLGKLSPRQKVNRKYLEEQYSCTIDNTSMRSSCPARHTDKQLLKMVELIFGKPGKPDKPGKPGSCILS